MTNFSFTAKEQAVNLRVLAGQSKANIAAAMGISPSAVGKHIRNIRNKLLVNMAAPMGAATGSGNAAAAPVGGVGTAAAPVAGGPKGKHQSGYIGNPDDADFVSEDENGDGEEAYRN